MKKYVFALAAATSLSLAGYAQDETEGLRFSRTLHQGTARFSSMGGAFAALGGDLTTMSFNPAGLGVYRAGEFAFTPALQFSSTDAAYMGTTTTDSRYQMLFSNIGGVCVLPTFSDGLVSFNIGVTYNKYNSFSERYAVRGKNITAGNTYLDYFAEAGNVDGHYSNGELVSDEAWMAYETYLIDFDSVNGRYTPAPVNQTAQRRTGEVSGDIGEYAFSIGGNVSHFLYFGITVGVQSLSYQEDLTDFEENTNRTIATPFNDFTYKRSYKMDGSGYNFKAGVIVRPFLDQDFLSGLRIGAAIHTPTFISMEDKFESDITAAFDDIGIRPANLEPSIYNYQIETPLRLMGGLAYTFGNQTSTLTGSISADYEYVDYSKIMLRRGDDGYDFANENDNIRNGYVATSNVRVGGELNYKAMSFRLGYSYYGNPYTKTAATGSLNKDGTVNIFAAGIGVHNSWCFLDFAYSLAQQKDKSYLYRLNNVSSSEVSYDISQSRVMLTFGLRF